MGSPVSLPSLCLISISMCRYSLHLGVDKLCLYADSRFSVMLYVHDTVGWLSDCHNPKQSHRDPLAFPSGTLFYFGIFPLLSLYTTKWIFKKHSLTLSRCLFLGYAQDLFSSPFNLLFITPFFRNLTYCKVWESAFQRFVHSNKFAIQDFWSFLPILRDCLSLGSYRHGPGVCGMSLLRVWYQLQ